jgi:hypothetical protein
MFRCKNEAELARVPLRCALKREHWRVSLPFPSTARSSRALLNNTLLHLGIAQHAKVPFFGEPVAMRRNPVVSRIPQKPRDEFRHGENPPDAAERSRQLDDRIAAQKDLPVRLTHQDHGAAALVGVLGEILRCREFTLQRGKLQVLPPVETHGASHPSRAKGAVTVKEENPSHGPR